MSKSRFNLRWNIIKTIWAKEVKDLLRDKITLIFILGMPFVVYPLTILLQTEAIVATQSHKKQTVSKLAIYESDASPFYESFKQEFRDHEQFNLIEYFKDPKLKELYESLLLESEKKEQDYTPFIDSYQSQLDSWIRSKEIDALAMVIPKDHADSSWVNHHLMILYDNTNHKSKLAYERLKDKTQAYRKELLKSRLEKNELDQSFITPMPIKAISFASTQKEVSNILGRVLPLLLVTCLVISIFHPSLNLTCSEKENKTLPTMLCTPIHHGELILGKYLTLIILAFLGLLANGLAISIMFVVGGISEIFEYIPTISEILTIFITLIPLISFYAALFLCFAILPKSYREGGNYMTPIFIIALVPATAAMLEFVELTPTLAMTPVTNVSLLLREVLVNPVSIDIIFLCIFSNTIWTVALLYMASMFFSREDILLNENLKFYDIFTLDRKAFPKPTLGMGVVVFFVLFCSFFYLSSFLGVMTQSIENGFFKDNAPLLLTIAVQVFVILGVPLFVCHYFKMEKRSVFSLHKPEAKAWLAALLLGCSMSLIAMISSQLISPPKEFAEKMEAAIFGNGERPLWILILAISIAPAICEEVAFRGIILKGFLNRLSPKWAIFLSSFLFALLHLSIYRLIPTFCLGLILGYALVKTGSLWITILMHALNNMVGVIAFINKEKLESAGMIENNQVIGMTIMIMFIGIILGFAILRKTRPRVNILTS